MAHLSLVRKEVSLEKTNKIFWRSLLDHIRRELQGKPVETILDVGCNEGGLLEKLASAFHPYQLIGIEPNFEHRERTSIRLKSINSISQVLPPERWLEVKDRSVDLLTCHEVLHLVQDLSNLFTNFERVLLKHGTAYVVTGCHTENPLWATWSQQLRNSGQNIFDHSPFDIIRLAFDAGLQCELRPLRRDGWIIYNPDSSSFKCPSIGTLIDHQYRNKLLFRLSRL